jgi:hypothetical protein
MIKYYFYGISEQTIGTYGAKGGGLTAILPIVALGYLFGYYLFYERNIWYLLLAVGFVIFGIVGEKAALLYFFPASFIGIYYLYIWKKGINVLKNTFYLAIIGILIAIISTAIIKFQPRLNPERKVGGSVEYSYAFDYTREYTSSTHYYNTGVATGRLSTTELVLRQIMNDGVPHIFLGYGPGSITLSVFGAYYDPRVSLIRRSYGITGFTFYLVEYGFLGVITIMIIYCIYIKRAWDQYRIESDSYWEAFSFGTLILGIMAFFAFTVYNTLPLNGDTFPPLFFYVMAVTTIRRKISL